MNSFYDYLDIKRQFKKLIKKQIECVSIPMYVVNRLKPKYRKKLKDMGINNNIEQTLNQMNFEFEYRLGE